MLGPSSCQDEKEQLIQSKSSVASLVGRSKTIVQLRPRNPEHLVKSTIPIKAVCDYRQIEVRLRAGCEHEAGERCLGWVRTSLVCQWESGKRGGGKQLAGSPGGDFHVSDLFWAGGEVLLLEEGELHPPQPNSTWVAASFGGLLSTFLPRQCMLCCWAV